MLFPLSPLACSYSLTPSFPRPSCTCTQTCTHQPPSSLAILCLHTSTAMHHSLRPHRSAIAILVPLATKAQHLPVEETSELNCCFWEFYYFYKWSRNSFLEFIELWNYLTTERLFQGLSTSVNWIQENQLSHPQEGSFLKSLLRWRTHDLPR